MEHGEAHRFQGCAFATLYKSGKDGCRKEEPVRYDGPVARRFTAGLRCAGIAGDPSRSRPDKARPPAMREQRPRRPGVVHDWQRCQAVHPALAPAGAGHQDWIEMCRNMKSCDSS